jgi:hypothetical protein
VHLTLNVHIGILSHANRSINFLRDQYNFWISDFLNSPFSGGVHFVCEIPVNLPGVSTAISLAGRMGRSRDQGRKRVRSLEYYLANSSAGFFLYTTDNAFVWSLNLKYLFDEVTNQQLTAGSHFIWGNCMSNYDGTFLQGGSGYFMSRYTAGRLLAMSGQWLPTVREPEDVAFGNLMMMAGLTSMYNATSEFMMGQYINRSKISAIQRIRLARIEKCPRTPPAAEGCRGFFSRFNRLVVLHRVSGISRLLSEQPRPVYYYPDNLLWYQPGEWSDVCLR